MVKDVSPRRPPDPRAGGQDRIYDEIEVSTEFLFKGYFRARERTVMARHDGWHRTGDIGFINSAELFVCGRLDDRIIVGGRNLCACQIERLTTVTEKAVSTAPNHQDMRPLQ